MKTFLASLILLCSLLLCSVLNCLFIDRVTSRLLEAERLFPDKAEEGERPLSLVLAEAEEEWERALPRLLCTVKASYISAVTVALHNTVEYYEHGSPADYAVSRTALTDALKALRAADSLSLKSIV